MIRQALPDETAELVALGEATGIFNPGETDALLRSTLNALHAGELTTGHQVRVWADPVNGRPGGWVYFGPRDPDDGGAWELFFIGVAPHRQGQGVGDALLRFVEAQVGREGGHQLFIETGSGPRLDRARRFYAHHGYAIESVQPNQFGEGDDKVTFRLTLNDAQGQARVEQATHADLDAVSALFAAQLAEHGVALEGQRLRSALAGLIEVPARGAILVARDGIDVIGFAVLANTWTVEHGGLVAWLDELYVVPARRGGGVGQALLSRALAEARSLGCLAVELEVDRLHARAEHL